MRSLASDRSSRRRPTGCPPGRRTLRNISLASFRSYLHTGRTRPGIGLLAGSLDGRCCSRSSRLCSNAVDHRHRSDSDSRRSRSYCCHIGRRSRSRKLAMNRTGTCRPPVDNATIFSDSPNRRAFFGALWILIGFSTPVFWLCVAGDRGIVWISILVG